MSDEYPSNSKNPVTRTPKPKQKLVVPNVRTRKKPLSSRIADRGTTIWKDVVFEIIRPYFRDMFADAFHRGVDQAFYFENQGQSHYRGPSARPGAGSPANMTAAGYIVTDYNGQYAGGQPQQSNWTPNTKPFDFTVWVFDNYAYGREVIDRLTHIIHSHNQATVNDLADMFGKNFDHPGENYGWDSLESLAGAEIRKVRGGGGYYLSLPDPRPINK
jgi:hypothetical protein